MATTFVYVNFQVDGVPATLTNLKNRLTEFWFPVVNEKELEYEYIT